MSDGIITNIEGQKVKLTNLDKLIYPEAGLIKAEIIQYYKQVAPIMLKYIAIRPLTLIRYPDGIDGKKFYSKDKPKWAPKWVKSVQVYEDDNHYVIASNTAIMVWLANLAALEIHPMQVKGPEYLFPDHFIFDLDPSPNFKFEDLKFIASSLREFLVGKGYSPFIKTSGSKGLHIYVPIFPRYEHDLFYESIKKMAQEFVSLHPKICTLRLSKERRLGKVLIDIYRNHRSNSCVAPYSLRARPFAPISMPFAWKKLDKIQDSQQFKLSDFDFKADAWEGFFDEAVEMHDHRSTQVSVESLASYEEKRDFDKTSEPTPKVISGNNDQFVVQLHDASNLHYDLRLEYDGVLMSWAIPKALPSSPETKRLAIRTEDHPVKYLDFEGSIPKNEYGGGKMWIVDRGRYTMMKKEEKKLKFILDGQFFKGSYSLINTKESQWLLTSKTDSSGLPNYKPMLAGVSKIIPAHRDYTYEVKWDGIRALLFIEKGRAKIISRSGSDLTSKFPELTTDLPFEVQSAVVDGEIVVLNDKGVSDFPKVISRLHSKFASGPQVVFYAFDILSLDGRPTINEPFTKRNEWLNVVLKKGNLFRVSELFDDGEALFTAGRAMGIEGIMAKRKDAKYLPGVRSDHWLKIKYRSEITALIIGYTEGSGDRMDTFGSLHLAVKEDSGLRYIGKVGSGFDGVMLKELKAELDKLPKSVKLIKEDIDEPRKTKWVKPVLECEVRFASWTKNKTLREPVFITLIVKD